MEQKPKTNHEMVNVFNSLHPLIIALYEEIQVLSKKKPDGTLNASKVQFINRLLADIKAFLKDEPGDKFLDMLNDEDLPQYSDVVLILSQYSASMQKFKNKYYGWVGNKQTWRVD